VLAYLLSTWTSAWRLPALWLMGCLGLAATAAGLGLSILALEADEAGAQRLVQESAQAIAVLVALWLLVWTLDADARSGFCVAADQTLGGLGARLWGRFSGCALVGVVASLPAIGAGATWTEADPLWLLITTIISTALLGAWGLLLWAWGLGGVALLLAGGGLWLLGHLPWGAPGWGGELGRWVGAWLPPGLDAQGRFAPAALGAVAGLLLLARASARAPADATGRRAP
jgi:hypothetical protein